MTGREIKKYRQELRDILESNSKKSKGDKERELKALAIKVGASIRSLISHDYASEPELADNINDALRTEAMILATKTASWRFIISIIAAGAAVISALAAWAAVLYN